MCDQTTNTTEQIKAGTVKAYAITSPERNDALPDVPTTAEAGLPNLEVSVWHGLYVPKDTPDEIVQALTAALKVALKDPNVIAKFAELGTVPVAEDQATPWRARRAAGVADRALEADHQPGSASRRRRPEMGPGRSRGGPRDPPPLAPGRGSE